MEKYNRKAKQKLNKQIVKMKTTKSTYETPLVRVEAVSTECGFATSGEDAHNSYGLQDFVGTDVNDQSDSWN